MNDVLLAAQPTKRFVTPEEVAALALFLCRDERRLDHRRQPQHGRRLDCRLGFAPMRSALLALALLAVSGCARVPAADRASSPSRRATGGRSRPSPTATRLRDWRDRLRRRRCGRPARRGPCRRDRARRRPARSRCSARRRTDPERRLSLPGDQGRRQVRRPARLHLLPRFHLPHRAARRTCRASPS